MNMKTKVLGVLIAAVAIAIPAVIVLGDDESSTSAAGSPTDTAFVAAMVPHHEGAIDMARMAEGHAEHNELRRLAKDIISAQRSEIAVMDRIGTDLHHMGVSMGHTGMSDNDTSMDGDMPMLESAKPFDRAFIDMMIPHHQGALRMARRHLADGEHVVLRKMARAIVAKQSREIAQMRAWRKAWYGSSEPSGSTVQTTTTR